MEPTTLLCADCETELWVDKQGLGGRFWFNGGDATAPDGRDGFLNDQFLFIIGRKAVSHTVYFLFRYFSVGRKLPCNASPRLGAVDRVPRHAVAFFIVLFGGSGSLQTSISSQL